MLTVLYEARRENEEEEGQALDRQGEVEEDARELVVVVCCRNEERTEEKRRGEDRTGDQERMGKCARYASENGECTYHVHGERVNE